MKRNPNPARVLRALKRKPYSVRELSALLHLSYPTTAHHVHQLLEDDRVHVSYTLYPVGAGRPTPHYLAGSKLHGERYKQLLALIEHAPLRVDDLAAAAGISYTLTARYIAALHSQERIHVGDWAKEGSCLTRMWRAGRGKDAPKPAGVAPKPRIRVRTRTDPEVLMKRANQAKAETIKPFRDPLTAALFGDAA